MKGTNVFINEDLCPGTVAARQAQMSKYHDARRAGKQVFWNYRKLVVRDPSPHRPLQHQGTGTPNPPASGTTTSNNTTTIIPTSIPENTTNPTEEQTIQPPSTASTHEFPCLAQHPNETQGATRPDIPAEQRRPNDAKDSETTMEQRVTRSTVQ